MFNPKAPPVGAQIQMSPLLSALLSLPPASPPGLALLERLLDRPHSPAEFLAMGPELAEAESQMMELADRSKKVIEQCLKLKPVPAGEVPAGF